MRTGGKIRTLPRITFGTGQALQAITVTSNMGFIRAAQCQVKYIMCLSHLPCSFVMCIYSLSAKSGLNGTETSPDDETVQITQMYIHYNRPNMHNGSCL